MKKKTYEERGSIRVSAKSRNLVIITHRKERRAIEVSEPSFHAMNIDAVIRDVGAVLDKLIEVKGGDTTDQRRAAKCAQIIAMLCIAEAAIQWEFQRAEQDIREAVVRILGDAQRARAKEIAEHQAREMQ